jgi:hypothetical protein
MQIQPTQKFFQHLRDALLHCIMYIAFPKPCQPTFCVYAWERNSVPQISVYILKYDVNIFAKTAAQLPVPVRKYHTKYMPCLSFRITACRNELHRR